MESMNRRWQQVQAHGSHSMALHTLQPGMKYFDTDAPGYIAYHDHGQWRFALADPVCAREHIPDLVRRFDAEHAAITFFHISESTGAVLEKLGYLVNEIGEEAVIDIDTYSFAGGEKHDIRHLHNRARRGGISVIEDDTDQKLMAEAKKISETWLSEVKHNSREMWFLARRPIYGEFYRARTFYGMQQERVMGLVTFDPVWETGEIVGYCASVLRRRSEAPKGIQDWIIHEALKTFRAEGIGWLSLGLLPCHHIQDDQHQKFPYSWPTMKLLRWSYQSRFANQVYGLRSLSFHKRRYRAPGRKVYMATRSRLPLVSLLTLARLSNIF